MSESEKNNAEFDAFLNDLRNAEKGSEEPAVQETAEEQTEEPAADENTEKAEEASAGQAKDEAAQMPVEEGEKAVYAEPVQPEKKRKWPKVLIAVAVVLCVLVGGGYLALYSFFGQFSFVPMSEQTGTSQSSETNIEPEPTDEPLNPELTLSADEYDTLIELLDANAQGNSIVMSDENVWNVLLIGADEMLSANSGRSDSMILVSVSHYTDTIVLTSFLRDSYLKIPGNGYNRLNAALPYGGVSLLAETIESNFGIHIDNYVMIDFDLFIDIINNIGGLYLTPTEDETDYINELMHTLGREDLIITTPNERTHFTGVQALYYARIRKMDSDIQRAERQRKILLAAKERLLSMDLPDILEIVNEFMPRVITDIDSKTCISLLFSAFEMLQDYDIQQHRIPMDGTYSDTYVSGMSVKRLYDFDTNTEQWKELVYGDNEPVTLPEEETQPVTDENGNDVIFTDDENDDSYDYGYDDYDDYYDYGYNDRYYR